jgi:hypothetical protein
MKIDTQTGFKLHGEIVYAVVKGFSKNMTMKLEDLCNQTRHYSKAQILFPKFLTSNTSQTKPYSDVK